MTRRYKPTFEEYVEIGKQLKQLNMLLVESGVYVSGCVGITFVDKYFNFMDIQRKLGQLRSQLEERMFREYPDKADVDIFYGGLPDES